LEETIGRLLIEKDEREPEKYHGGNCCMTFVDASPSLERGLSAAPGNCCIKFKSSKIDQQQQERERRKWNVVACILLGLFVCGTIVLIEAVKHHKE
jgi:hypothetical protein